MKPNSEQLLLSLAFFVAMACLIFSIKVEAVLYSKLLNAISMIAFVAIVKIISQPKKIAS
ncbi:MAG: hypothetical protein R2825_20405 [Saprospiraceae bacterium]